MDTSGGQAKSGRKGLYTFVALLLLVVAVVAAVGLTLPSSPIAGVQASTSTCAQSFFYPTTNQTTLSNGTEITEAATPVFLMSPGSTMDICVSYASFNNNTYSGQAYNSISSWGAGGQFQTAQSVTVVASPADISVTEGYTTYATYEVTAGQHSTGFYGLSMLQLCVPTPVAVGYGSTQLNSSDFPGLFGSVYGCPAITLQARIVGYSGASVAYLESKSSFNPSLNISDVSVSSYPTPEGAENITLKMELQSFSYPIALAPALNQSIVRVFEGNPELTTLPVGDYCSWYPNNQSAVNDMNVSTFQDQTGGYMQVDAPVLQLGTYSNASYSVSILISGPIARYTAIDVILYSKVPGSPEALSDIVAYFPVSVAGQLQTVSGSCNAG